MIANGIYTHTGSLKNKSLCVFFGHMSKNWPVWANPKSSCFKCAISASPKYGSEADDLGWNSLEPHCEHLDSASSKEVTVSCGSGVVYYKSRELLLFTSGMRGRCYDRNFRQFSPIFGKKIGAFPKTQYYDLNFAKIAVSGTNVYIFANLISENIF
jgi:hypothetical protein